MESYDEALTDRAKSWCADGHMYADEREHFAEVAHAWDDIPAHLRGLTACSGTMAGLAVAAGPMGTRYPEGTPEYAAFAAYLRAELAKFARGGHPCTPAPAVVADLAAMRALLRRARADGWTFDTVYGEGEFRQHVWHRGPQVIDWFANKITFKPNLRGQSAVTLTREWDGEFDLGQVAKVAEILGFLSPIRVEAGSRLPCVCANAHLPAAFHDRDCPRRYAPRLAYRAERFAG